ncbi:MAG: DUF4325 domain-containing protein [Rectinemataceae bacterium]|nr:DUF4325 domain-containing protein [Rectinemataceae bacterium]
MTVSMIKFGDILISRPAGREAFLAGASYVFKDAPENDEIILDFKGVKVLAPSWGDEFITGLKTVYKNHVAVTNADSPAVRAALKYVLPV